MYNRITRRTVLAALTGTAISATYASTLWGHSSPAASQERRRNRDGISVPMVGVDAGGTRFSPGYLPSRMPKLRSVALPGRVVGTAAAGSASILQHGNHLFVNSEAENGDDGVLALNAMTGEERWNATGIDNLWALTEDSVIVSRVLADTDTSPAQYEFVALDLDTGTNERWAYQVSIGTRIVVIDQVVLLAPSEGIVALDATSGTSLWEYDYAGEFRPDDMAANDGVVVCTHPTESSSILALDTLTGEKRWSIDVGIRIQTPPLIVDGTVYVGAPNDLISLNVATGDEISRVSHGLALFFQGTLAATDSNILVKNNRQMSAINSQSLEIDWIYTPLYGFKSEFVCASGMAIAQVGEGPHFEDGVVYEAIDLSTGSPVYELPARGSADVDRILDSSHIGEGLIYLMTFEGLLIYEGSEEPFAGITTPFDGDSFTSPTLGYRVTWTDAWTPIKHDEAFGEDEFALSSPDSSSVVMVYTVEATDYPAAQDAANYVAQFPIYFTDTSMLIGLAPRPFDRVPDFLPDDAGVAFLYVETRFNPPIDEMRFLFFTFEIPGHNRYLIFELGSGVATFEEVLEPFYELVRSLELPTA